MRWKKYGLIFTPKYDFSWMKGGRTWAPTAEYLGEDVFKIYFGCRNADNLTQTGFFTFNMNEPAKTILVSAKPIILLGELGSFDDSLALACSFVQYQNVKLLYYVGWMQGKRVRYYPSIGLAVSTNNGETFRKFSRAPIFERNDDEPFGMASPFVMRDGGIFRMWYASYRRWDMRGEESWPHYEIRSAESVDGLHWKGDNVTCIGSDTEEAVARPYVLKENGLYKMWYCYRLEYGDYRIGYAESIDGKKWERKDTEAGIDVSQSDWDSQMVVYPCIFDHKGKRYMLYNGNGFGETGIGLAEEVR